MKPAVEPIIPSGEFDELPMELPDAMIRFSGAPRRTPAIDPVFEEGQQLEPIVLPELVSSIYFDDSINVEVNVQQSRVALVSGPGPLLHPVVFPPDRAKKRKMKRDFRSVVPATVLALCSETIHE